MLSPSTLFRTVALALASLILISTGCKKKHRVEIDPAYAQFISAFTSGTISAAGTIRVRFTTSVREDFTSEVIADEARITFSPDIEGKIFWIDSQTLEFRPSQWLTQGEVYTAELDLNALIPVPEHLKKFAFSFSVLQQHMETEVTAITAYSNSDLRKMKLTGLVRTIDVCNTTELEKCLDAHESSVKLPITWTHSDDLREHYFTVDSIRRHEAPDSVLVHWNGNPIGSSQDGKISQEIPALGDFKVFFYSVVQQPEQYVVLQFSDPLEPAQNLEGIIDLPEVYGERYTLEGNEIRIYPPYRLSGELAIFIHAGVRNIMGISSKNEQTITLLFEDLKPQVELPDNQRVILPSTDGMVFPFKAVNLSAVDVRVIRVFENNIAQFLQVNDLSGEEEMKRVGRQVTKKTIPLNPDGSKDLAQWNTFYLNLGDIIRTEPGAIYRIEVGFRKSYSLYACGGTAAATEEENEITENWDEAEGESSYWDYFDDYWGGEYYDEYYGYDYDWEQRDNPCDAAYYKSRRPVAKNILASDIGLIAKKGSDLSMDCFVTNLLTAKPSENAEIEIINFQQQPLFKGRTDSDGHVHIQKIEGTPFLLTARKGKNVSYLKLDNGHSLSISTFDVGGSATEKGLKGMIYGERGVWRPGDTLHLAFMLEDKRMTLPTGHPIQFELIDPRGKSVRKLMRSVNETGIYPLTCSTSPDAPTGMYSAQVRVGGALFTKSLRIETIQPNRLKLALDFGKDRITSVDKKMEGTLSARWLHGAVARNLKARVTATFTPGMTRFDRYDEYTFDDPVKQFSAEEQVIFDSGLNAEGVAKIPFEADLGQRSPGMVNANFSVKVFEEGGAFSVDRFSIPYAPYDYFVGLKLPKGDKSRGMLLTDKDHMVDVVTLDATGKPVQRKDLIWKIYKVNWRWWWEQGTDDLASYVGSESTIPVAEGSFGTSATGKGSFTFQIHYPDWGRYLIRIEDKEGGHSTGQSMYIDWPGWAGRAQRENPGGASMLMFSLDKEKYAIGETCTVTIPSSGEGRALVSIENGSRVIESKWIETDKEQTLYTFRTTEDMAPNAYVHITLIQPHSQTVNDMPMRLYGVMPLFVENPDSHLQPVITMASELTPEKPFDVKVGEQQNRGMSYTLAVVDEGLLDLTRFKTPAPWDHFYAREALGVNTFDMYDEVIGALGAKMDRLLSIGGSDETGSKGKNRANRFEPVVMYLGPFTLKAGECRTHRMKMPNYVGSVRVMVVAGKESAYGHAEKTVPVKKPLMVLATLPRVLGPGETVQLPVTIFAMDPKVSKVNISVEPNDLIQLSEPNERSVNFKEPGDLVSTFRMMVKDREGIAKVKITASSGSYTSTCTLEIDVRSPNPYQTTYRENLVESGKDWSLTFDMEGMAGTNSALLEVSTIPPIDFGRRLKYLLDYPHGCVEQTTSQAFPQLYLADVMELGEKERKRASENVKIAINKLAQFQTPKGGLTYWPGNADADEWCTSYVGHFMWEAKKKGFTLPAGFESDWLGFQKRAAQNWRMPEGKNNTAESESNDLMQAYRLYTLALAGQPEMGAMNRLKERPDMSDPAKWRLAAAYALSGQKETAKQLIARAPAVAKAYSDPGYSFGSRERDDASIIETLVLLNERTKAASLVKDLSAKLSSDTWYSTQSTAFGLLAVSRFAAGESGKEIRFTTELNGKKSAEQLSRKPALQQNIDVKMKGNKMIVRNTSGNLLYARLILSGKPLNGNELPSSKNLHMDLRYFTLDGKPLQVSRIEQGTDFYAEVAVNTEGLQRACRDLALTQVFPSGWEIINSRMDPGLTASSSDIPEYQDFRDDRVLSYFDLTPGKTKKFLVKLNASYLGHFYLPGTLCEAMYENSIQARSKGMWVDVVTPGSAATAMKK